MHYDYYHILYKLINITSSATNLITAEKGASSGILKLNLNLNVFIKLDVLYYKKA